MQTESLPYVYYSPSYGYAESSYNPYNPYIPGAMFGVDDPFIGTQQYYTIPSHEISMYSPAYYPMVQSGPDIIASDGAEPLDSGSFRAKSVDGVALKNKVPSTPATLPPVPGPVQTKHVPLLGYQQALKLMLDQVSCLRHREVLYLVVFPVRHHPTCSRYVNPIFSFKLENILSI